MMTLEQILEDIKSPRVKKCILDSDMYNEVDDQYAFAYCLASDKVDLKSVNAAPFHNEKSSSFEDGMYKSFDETMHILDLCDMKLPVYKGATKRISDNANFAPVDSEGARNIIKTVKESDEIVYVLSIGTCVDVVSAYLMDPSIADNMCVIWLGGTCLDHPNSSEFNLCQDFKASQLLFDLDIPLVMVPCATHGAMELVAFKHDLDAHIKGNGKAQVFFRDEFPLYSINEPSYEGYGEWNRILWDVSVPGIITVPDAYELNIIPAPIVNDNVTYGFDDSRRKIIYMEKLHREIILKDCFENISKL